MYCIVIRTNGNEMQVQINKFVLDFKKSESYIFETKDWVPTCP